MKRRLFFLLIIIITAFLYTGSANAQTGDELPEKPKYSIWVTHLDDTPQFRGNLTHLKDSLIMASDVFGNGSTSIYYRDIETFKFRKKGAVGRGILTGAAVGFALGAVIGYTTWDDSPSSSGGWLTIDFDRETTTLAAGIGSMIPGAIIGGILSSKKITIPINGKTANQKQEIRKKLQF